MQAIHQDDLFDVSGDMDIAELIGQSLSTDRYVVYTGIGYLGTRSLVKLCRAQRDASTCLLEPYSNISYITLSDDECMFRKGNLYISIT